MAHAGRPRAGRVHQSERNPRAGGGKRGGCACCGGDNVVSRATRRAFTGAPVPATFAAMPTHRPARRPARAIAAALALVATVAAGCGDTTPTPGVSGDPETLTYAPELKVSLAAMTKRPSGLYVQDVVVGTGAPIDSMTTAQVHYTGWLADGTKFDTSRDLGAPFTFTVGIGQVIPAWDEGVRGMRVGGKRRLVTPPILAYGNTRTGPIPASATLVFDVEAVAVVAPEPTGLRKDAADSARKRDSARADSVRRAAKG